jgi:SpoVK/Ycf46/Vps4 family AAA+-type ATPase
MRVDPGVNWGELARSTDEFGGAMLKAVCVEAGMIALRSGKNKIGHEHYVDAIAEVQAKKKDVSIRYFNIFRQRALLTDSNRRSTSTLNCDHGRYHGTGYRLHEPGRWGLDVMRAFIDQCNIISGYARLCFLEAKHLRFKTKQKSNGGPSLTCPMFV